MHITLVKKIKADGSPCKKCGEVEDRLKESGDMAKIDEVVIADEGDPESPGMKLAQELNVERAPFFVVDYDDGKREVHTVYFKFVKDVLNQKTEEKDELKEIMNDNPDLDFL